jgi:hypothetical protein
VLTGRKGLLQSTLQLLLMSSFSYAPTLLRSYAPTLLRSYAPTLLRSYAPTLLRSYAPVTMRPHVGTCPAAGIAWLAIP